MQKRTKTARVVGLFMIMWAVITLASFGELTQVALAESSGGPCPGQNCPGDSALPAQTPDNTDFVEIIYLWFGSFL